MPAKRLDETQFETIMLYTPGFETGVVVFAQLKGSAPIVKMSLATAMAAVTATELELPPEKNRLEVLLEVGTAPVANMALGTLSKPRMKLYGVKGCTVTVVAVGSTEASGLGPSIAVGAVDKVRVGK